MDTQTHLIATPQQARRIAQALLIAAGQVQEGQESLVHVRETLEQTTDRGPWRLILSVSN